MEQDTITGCKGVKCCRMEEGHKLSCISTQKRKKKYRKRNNVISFVRKDEQII